MDKIDKNTKPKPKPKPKIKVKPKPKIKVKPKPKIKNVVKNQKNSKDTFPKNTNVIVEIDKSAEGSNPQKYLDKLKNLIYKIKNQTLETDNGIRLGWK